MCEYYFDEDHGVAYKVNPVQASVVNSVGGSNAASILVLTDVKVTNMKKEKVRRTLSQVYPTETYDLDQAKRVFADTMVSRFVSGARRISEQEYQTINSKYEA